MIFFAFVCSGDKTSNMNLNTQGKNPNDGHGAKTQDTYPIKSDSLARTFENRTKWYLTEEYDRGMLINRGLPECKVPSQRVKL